MRACCEDCGKRRKLVPEPVYGGVRFCKECLRNDLWDMKEERENELRLINNYLEETYGDTV